MVHTTVHKKNKVNGRVKYEKICVYCTKEVQYFHGKKPQVCPHCGASDYIKPPTETKLFLIQNEYLKDRSSEYLSELFVILKAYATSIIKKNLPKDFIYHYDKLDEKAQDAATLFIEYYLVYPDFKVEKSFGGYLQWKVKEVLWNKKLQREEDHESLNHIGNKSWKDGDSTQSLDWTMFANMQPIYGTIEDHTQALFTESTDDLILGIINIINESMIQLRIIYNTDYYVLLSLYGICLILEGKTEIYMDKFYHHFGSKIKKDVDLIKLLIFRFIKERE